MAKAQTQPAQPAQVIPLRKVDVTALSRQLIEAENDTQRAIARLQEMASSDPDLLAELTRNSLRAACTTAIRSVVTSDRSEVWAKAAKTPVSSPVNFDAWGGAVAASLMDQYRLSDGRPLGDGRKADLAETAANYEGRARDMMSKGRWMRAIIERLPDDQATVRDTLTEADLRQLQEGAMV